MDPCFTRLCQCDRTHLAMMLAACAVCALTVLRLAAFRGVYCRVDRDRVYENCSSLGYCTLARYGLSVLLGLELILNYPHS